ncbi:hypothetical protein O5698_01025 [Escherichia coli]|nr:hypothetical protein [Escherichia coli]
MTDEIDRISEVVLNERQSVVKAWQTRTKKRPTAGASAMTAERYSGTAPCGAAGCGDLY